MVYNTEYQDDFAIGSYGAKLPLTETEKELTIRYGLQPFVFASPGNEEEGIEPVKPRKEFELIVRKGIIPNQFEGLTKDNVKNLFQKIMEICEREVRILAAEIEEEQNQNNPLMRKKN